MLVHTRIPPAIRERGVAGRLVEAAVKLASREELQLVPWCPYARHWLRENEDLTLGVQIDWFMLPQLRAHWAAHGTNRSRTQGETSLVEFLDPSAPPVTTVASGDVVSDPDTWTHWGNEAADSRWVIERRTVNSAAG
jgi:GCN5-related N-acetyl-transferase